MNRYTIICDIDGVILKHPQGNWMELYNTYNPSILPNVREKFIEWNKKGYIIILISGRKESMRPVTEKQLELVGINYDQLILGATNAIRVLINDKKSDEENTAIAFSIDRDKGLEDINI